MTTLKLAFSSASLLGAVLCALGCGDDPAGAGTMMAGTGAPMLPNGVSGVSGASGATGTAGAPQAGAVAAPPSDPPMMGPVTPPSGSGGASGGSGSGTAGSVAPAAGSGGSPPATGGSSSGSGGSVAPAADTIPTLYWLDINANRVMRAQNIMMAETIVSRTGTAPDGIAIDVAGGKIYWTNMGSLLGSGGGSLQRANLDGTMVETIVPAGLARTPKQMQVDLVNRHVYFCDREGAKVWRAGMDGSQPEAIVSGHGFEQLVGVALDVPAGKFYFSDRLGGKILRANMAMPAGETGANRTDIEELFVFSGNAMPIDLDVDHTNKKLYWTDRELGTVQRAGLDIPAGQTAQNRSDAQTLVTGLVETIGISLDIANDRMYFSELGGEISSSKLDGTDLKRRILRSGSATGVAIAHIPKP